MTDYLTLAKELSRKHCMTVGNAHQTLADILQEAVEAERMNCMALAQAVIRPIELDRYSTGWNDAAARISASIWERI